VQQLIQGLIRKACMTTSVLWNGQVLSEKQLEENIEHIKSYKITQAHSGYWCSSCDPFLLLICELFDVNINHKYMSTNIKYTKDKANKTLYFASNRNHFWFVKRTNE
jgi:hypothetical protein